MSRAGGSLTNVSVDGISHGNGVQEGNAISIRNRVCGRRHQRPARPGRPGRRRRHELPEDRSAPRRQPHLHGQERARGPRRGPAGSAQPDHRGQLAADLPRRLRLGHRQHVQAQQPRRRQRPCSCTTPRTSTSTESPSTAPRAATTGINVSNISNTIDTTFTMRGGAVTGTATAAGSVGVAVVGQPGRGDRHADRHHGRRLEHGDQGRGQRSPP